jgi:hypothetical protein
MKKKSNTFKINECKKKKKKIKSSKPFACLLGEIPFFSERQLSLDRFSLLLTLQVVSLLLPPSTFVFNSVEENK